MSKTINGSFQSRRDAEMAVERLVQEFALERTDIFISADGEENSAGPARAGSDNESAGPGHGDRDDGAHGGTVIVSVDVNDETLATRVSAAFDEFNATAPDHD
jgi:hypothetical protein